MALFLNLLIVQALLGAFDTIYHQGWKSWFLSIAGIGVMASGLRDALASRHLTKYQAGAKHRAFNCGHSHQRFLISGATGFIGSALVERLLNHHHAITILTRDPIRANLMFQGAVRAIRSTNELANEEQFDAVINLSGAPVVGPLWTKKRKQILLSSRLDTTEDLLRFVQRAKTPPKTWIQASAIGYYGQQATSTVEEVEAPISDFASELCHRWEDKLKELDKLSVRKVILRFGLVLGNTGGVLPALVFALKWGGGMVLGSGKQWVSWIHLDDVMQLIATSIHDSHMKGAFNVVAPDPKTYAEFLSTMGKVHHRPVWLRMPDKLLRLLMGEMATMLLDGPRALPERLIAQGYGFQFPTLEAALRDLNQ